VSALRERYIKAGLSPDYASFISELDEKIKNGKEKRITPYSGTHHGKKPRSLADFANEHAGVCFNSFLRLNGLFCLFLTVQSN